LFEGTTIIPDSGSTDIPGHSAPPETKIFCGHEYTIDNLKFCMEIDKNNSQLTEKFNLISSNIKNKLSSMPSILSDEMRLNIFLKFDNLEFKKSIGFEDLNEVDFFKKIRDLKNNF
jgi:hydroxyacylglutathione hydrolase